MELIVIRHGLPVSEQRTDGGAADPGLSERGHRQAEALAELLSAEDIDAVYSSPMQRAVHTAEPLRRRLGLGVQLDEDLREYDSGMAFYLPLHEVSEASPEQVQQALARMEQVGSTPFQSKVVEAMERIIARHPGGRVAVTCHGGVINAWASHVIGSPRVLFFHPDYTSINRFRASRGGNRGVVSLNDCTHLHPERLHGHA